MTAVESEAKKKMDAALVKQLTGGDTITARALYQHHIEFQPELKLWLATNHKPKIPSTEEAMWRRVHLVPFTVTFPPGKCDPNLPQKLEAELPGILAWALRGCLDWQRQGSNPPSAVTNATRMYRSENDDVTEFIRDCVESVSHGRVTKKDMHEAYRRWCSDNAGDALSVRELTARLTKLGLIDGKSGSSRVEKRRTCRCCGRGLRSNGDRRDRKEPETRKWYGKSPHGRTSRIASRCVPSVPIAWIGSPITVDLQKAENAGAVANYIQKNIRTMEDFDENLFLFVPQDRKRLISSRQNDLIRRSQGGKEKIRLVSTVSLSKSSNAILEAQREAAKTSPTLCNDHDYFAKAA